MADKFKIVLVLLGFLTLGTACPTQCDCTYNREETNYNVDCSGRNLRSLPHDIPTNTKVLNMSNNLMTEISDNDASWIARMDLHQLDLSYNQITELTSERIMLQGKCDLGFIDRVIPWVHAGSWGLYDLSSLQWPCMINLRGNPLSQIHTRAFAGSQNFTLFLGKSLTQLIIDQSALSETSNVIGVQITDVHLTLSAGSFTGMTNVGCIVIDRTTLSTEGQLFDTSDSLQLQWFRMSNSDISQLATNAFQMNMNVITSCYVNTYPYGHSKITSESKDYIEKGGVEIFNNTFLDPLPERLFGRASVGGILFKENTIAGFSASVFARHANDPEVCAIIFTGNEFDVLPSNSFKDVKNVVFLSIAQGGLRSIEANAFQGLENVGSLSFGTMKHNSNANTLIKQNAFSNMGKVKVFGVGGIDANDPRPVLTMASFAFSGLQTDYMAVNIYKNMQTLPDNLFTGVTVDQQFVLRPQNLSRIAANAFGGKNSRTRIARLQVEYLQYVPCDCEAAMLYVNIKENVERWSGLTCTAPFEDGTISHSWHLDHATCAGCGTSVNLPLVLMAGLVMMTCLI